MPGIAAGTSIASWLNVVMMMATLARKGHYRPGLRATSKLLRCLAASAILGGLLALTAWFRTPLQGALAWVQLGPLGPKEMLIALVVMAAGAIYPVLLFATGGITPAEARIALLFAAVPPMGPKARPTCPRVGSLRASK